MCIGVLTLLSLMTVRERLVYFGFTVLISGMGAGWGFCDWGLVFCEQCVVETRKFILIFAWDFERAVFTLFWLRRWIRSQGDCLCRRS